MTGFIIFVVLTLTGFIFGRINEASHFKRLAASEQALSRMTLISYDVADAYSGDADIGSGALVSGSVVIANDAFKKLMAALRMFFGGRIKAYESLMERARREALVRMQQQAQAMGADEIINVRLETSTMLGKAHQVGAFEVFAYGTAITR